MCPRYASTLAAIRAVAGSVPTLGCFAQVRGDHREGGLAVFGWPRTCCVFAEHTICQVLLGFGSSKSACSGTRNSCHTSTPCTNEIDGSRDIGRAPSCMHLVYCQQLILPDTEPLHFSRLRMRLQLPSFNKDCDVQHGMRLFRDFNTYVRFCCFTSSLCGMTAGQVLLLQMDPASAAYCATAHQHLFLLISFIFQSSELFCHLMQYLYQRVLLVHFDVGVFGCRCYFAYFFSVPVVPTAAINELGDALLCGKHVGTHSSFVLNNCSCNRLPPVRCFWTLCKLLDCSLHTHFCCRSWVLSSFHGLAPRGCSISSPQLLHCSLQVRTNCFHNSRLALTVKLGFHLLP